MSTTEFATMQDVPVRLPYIPETLASLKGTKEIFVNLPKSVYWAEPVAFDLSDKADLRYAYKLIVDNAKSISDFSIVSYSALKAMWATLRVADKTRAAWEAKYPELAQIG